MKILSIDVGIKNMAYCLFLKKNDQFLIEMWGIINLCEEKKKCCELNCKKNAKFQKNNLFYCKICAKKKNYLIPTQEIANCKKKNEFQTILEKYHLSYPKKSTKKDFQKIISDHFFEYIYYKKSKEYNIVYLGRKLKEEFETLFPNIDQVDHIIIENQISPSRMKTLQGMIIQHCIEKNCQIIKEISAANKLKFFLKQKTTYNERKKLSIQKTLEFIRQYHYLNKWESFFLNNSKKDDLSDSFLQGLWYLQQIE